MMKTLEIISEMFLTEMGQSTLERFRSLKLTYTPIDGKEKQTVLNVCLLYFIEIRLDIPLKLNNLNEHSSLIFCENSEISLFFIG